MSELLASKAYFAMDIPGPGETTAKFIYRYFEPTESYDETAAYLGNQSDRQLALVGGARAINFKMNPPDKTFFDTPYPQSSTAKQIPFTGGGNGKIYLPVFRANRIIR